MNAATICVIPLICPDHRIVPMFTARFIWPINPTLSTSLVQSTFNLFYCCSLHLIHSHVLRSQLMSSPCFTLDISQFESFVIKLATVHLISVLLMTPFCFQKTSIFMLSFAQIISTALETGRNRRHEKRA